MVSGRQGSNLAVKTPSKNKSEDNVIASLQLPEPDVIFNGATSGDHLSPINQDDIVIAVMGPTGAGKTSFVNMTAGKENVKDFDLRPKTRALEVIRCPHPDGRRSIVVVDTPGFDDLYLSDAQILRIIANWLKDTYQNSIKLSGLLYLHRISDVRMAGTPLRNLSVFQGLCGDENLKNVILVTTMWDEVEDKSVGSERENELLSSFWKGMIDRGSRTRRYQGTHESAWGIINLLDLNKSHPARTPLQIQREMVDRKLPFEETTASKTLLRSFIQAVGEFKRVWARMRNGIRRKAAPKFPPASPLRNAMLRRTSTRGSFETSWSMVSSVDTTSISSNGSGYLSSPTGTASSGCSIVGRQDALLVTITGLSIAHQVADMASIPVLRGTIGTVLCIARMIQAMGGTHHAISQVVENSGWLLEEIVQHAAESKLSADMKKTLSFFQRELSNLQKVVMKIKERNILSRFFLHEADIQAITACTASIKQIYDKLEVKLALDNRQAIARLEDQIRELFNHPGLRQCECGGMSTVHEEESHENGQHAVTLSHSS